MLWCGGPLDTLEQYGHLLGNSTGYFSSTKQTPHRALGPLPSPCPPPPQGQDHTLSAAEPTCASHVQVVEPKRVALRGAEAMLIAANAHLQEKQAALKAVVAKVAALEKALAAAQAEQGSLKQQASVTATRLQRAAKLTSGLQEEGVRWGRSAHQIEVRTAGQLHSIQHAVVWVAVCFVLS